MAQAVWMSHWSNCSTGAELPAHALEPHGAALISGQTYVFHKQTHPFLGCRDVVVNYTVQATWLLMCIFHKVPHHGRWEFCGRQESNLHGPHYTTQCCASLGRATTSLYKTQSEKMGLPHLAPCPWDTTFVGSQGIPSQALTQQLEGQALSRLPAPQAKAGWWIPVCLRLSYLLAKISFLRDLDKETLMGPHIHGLSNVIFYSCLLRSLIKMPH